MEGWEIVCFSPVAGILLVERHLIDTKKSYVLTCFSPVAGILLVESWKALPRVLKDSKR